MAEEVLQKGNYVKVPAAQNKPILGGTSGKAQSELQTRKQKLDTAERDAVGYKNGGIVKMTPKATPYKCGGSVKR